MRHRFPVILVCLGLGWASQPGTRAASPGTVRVAVYDDLGASRKLVNLLEVLGEHTDLHVDRVKAEAIRSGCLAGYDVLIQPGGTGSGQAKALGTEGREKIREFVSNGGGYLGICAGAYLASSDYPWSLHILDARVIDKQHWDRGSGNVEIALTAKGQEILGVAAERRSIHYYQGPLLAPADDPEVPDYDVLARFDGEIAKNGAPAGVMKGTTAIAAAPYGSGRVLCLSPHAEQTANLHGVVYRALLWVTRREAVESGHHLPYGTATAAQPTPKGERVFVCGHSFHAFVAEPLAALAKEAGIRGHTTVGVQFLGNSRPIRHWNLPDEQNTVKRALRAGAVDVLTLAPHSEVPDEGIDRFADLAAEHNPNVRVFLQLSWAPFDGKDPARFTIEDRDRVTLADVNPGFRLRREPYLDRLRKQAQAINERHGRPFVFIVPAAVALDRLREEVIAGRAPGITKQSELFKDLNGHRNQPLKNLVTYCWFAAVYHRSPVGLTSLETNGDRTSRPLNRLLEQIAWEAVTQEPSSGTTAP